MSIQLLLLIVALVLFVLSACNVPSRINLVSAGLALCVGRPCSRARFTAGEMCAICPCCGYDIAKDEPIERAGIAMAPYGPVRFNGTSIHLTRGETAVLWTLMKADRPIARHILAERYGQGEYTTSNPVDVLLTRIKQKLAPHGEPPIRNRRGVGVYIEA